MRREIETLGLWRRAHAVHDFFAQRGGADVARQVAPERVVNSLEVQSLTKTFGGLRAVQDVSFAVLEGTVHAIIGPNGAGKTTLINLITGMYTPTFGRVLLNTRDITAKAPMELPALGMARTFQNLQICMNMSALDNVMVGAHLRQNSGLIAGLLSLPRLRREDRVCRADALKAMERVGLSSCAKAEAGEMPYGALKRLEIARALMTRPSLLLMDEPAAGLNPTETASIGKLIRQLAAEGLTVVLVEHDMPLVMGVSDTITVLDHGRKIAQGTPTAIRANEQVIAAYLGADGVSEAGTALGHQEAA
ncbi:MAG: ABC transporter ATP-binding protein [Hydrogenophaga sp.]|uniref:ABC transporter ATP-binding protein n=2 Tax=Hydrogenophaga sp. TaxID=1904254 RepID=UPI001D495FFF|nr:ABC transporter ATP-binding protein [Hydrogenophaga sp.]MBW0172680.1 ABC transporter ATP-binding protein [Hydrogenophaga sp.]MBW0183646.1 ABC transporter ATP-binding protein [Hydrogenophaga sp.]